MSVFPNTKTIIDLCTSLGAYKYHDFVSEATSLYMFCTHTRCMIHARASLSAYSYHGVDSKIEIIFDLCTEALCVNIVWFGFQTKLILYLCTKHPHHHQHPHFHHQHRQHHHHHNHHHSHTRTCLQSNIIIYIYIFMHRALVHKTIMVCWQSKTMIDLWIKPQCIKLPWLCWHKQKPW